MTAYRSRHARATAAGPARSPLGPPSGSWPSAPPPHPVPLPPPTGYSGHNGLVAWPPRPPTMNGRGRHAAGVTAPLADLRPPAPAARPPARHAVHRDRGGAPAVHRRHARRHERLFVRADGTWRGTTALALIATVVCGVSLVGTSFAATSAPPPFVPAAAGASAGAGTGATAPASAPVRLAIGAIKVDAPVRSVDVDQDGMLEAPPLGTPKDVGWYERGPTPGEAGNSVLVGHVDTAATGPAVFYELGKLKVGDEVAVTRADGSAVNFRVDSVRMFSKANFPADLVYGPAKQAQLRLVTCGGAFDARQGSYLANTVVTATMTGWRPR
ncbi:class F sortase [Dactylosporangium sp. AC04546]|uniref:class F sortase n=1 Tax=Dactylosporangium sp. AC04546 TaxID=2862460 RepID=UPI001EE11D72|nr:class F sortase [Dactylosporangium sp. AC04546]WVK85856.1 class F sortase [Dactylosporangium sp. AC04546]